MAKAKKVVKKSAAKEALGSPAFSSKTVLFPDAVASKKPVKRSTAKLIKVRKARKELLASMEREDQQELSESTYVPARTVVKEPVLESVPVCHAKPETVHHAAKPAVKKAQAPHKGIFNAACFWAGSVLSDSNAFLRQKAK